MTLPMVRSIECAGGCKRRPICTERCDNARSLAQFTDAEIHAEEKRRNPPPPNPQAPTMKEKNRG